MNLSASEHIYNSSYNGNFDRMLRSPTEKQTPPIVKRLLPGSWHGEKTSPRQTIPGPPLSSPSPLLSPDLKKFQKSPIFMATPLPFIVSPSKQKRSPNLLRRLSQGGSSASNILKEAAVPALYRYARKCQWDDFEKALQVSSKDMTYAYKKDGTTVLHMAVMSRTGYINCFKSSTREFATARLEIVEKLLQLNPGAARIRCTLNGYTPLTYACLVCDDEYDVEAAAAMVRLFLKYCPESVHIFTNEGLSPVDIHIVSYSAHHTDKEDESALGRTSTAVLRKLLTHSPDLANLRLRGDKVEGPIEFLYKCNVKAFSRTVMNEVYNSDDEGTVRSDFTIPERRQKVIDSFKKWWIWTWAVMILKYGSLKQKKRGCRFAAVHTAAMQVGCPTPLMSITMYAFPRQIKQPVEDKDEIQNLPLHAVCSWPCHQDYKSAGEAMVSSRKSTAIARAIEEYPLAVKVRNNRGETALELALVSGTTWDGGVRRLVKTYPKALKLASKQTGLFPFMTAAAAAKSPSQKLDLQSVRTIYGLLRSNPKILVQTWQKGQGLR